MSDRLTAEQAVAAVRRGERVAGKHSRHDKQIDVGPHHCRWRVIYCWNSEEDVCECSVCGRQEVFACDFDEEFA